jgi:hypothetical protein
MTFRLVTSSPLFIVIAMYPFTHRRPNARPRLYIFVSSMYVDYTAYNRNELDGLGLGKYTDTLLESQSKGWNDLNDDEREAATRFCFFEEIWDRDPLGTW